MKFFDLNNDIQMASVLNRPLLGILALLVLPACGGSRDAAAKTQAGTDSIASSVVGAGSAIAAPGATQPGATPGSTQAPGGAAPALPPGPGSVEVRRLRSDPSAPIRGLYINRFAAQSTKKMRRLIGIADSTEINAFVIDIKDEFGLNFHSSDPLLQKNEGATAKVANLKALVDTLNAHGILPVARIVVFKDSVAARANPGHTIRRNDGSAWRDHKGLAWVNPYANSIWEYNFRVAEEAAKMGFGEIQYDYIRFPEPYKSLPAQVFPESNGRTKSQALAEFLNAAKKRLDKYGVRTTADIFGLVTTVNGALEVGQAWEPLTKAVDVLLPMVYPSHYPRGSFGIPRPNADPYKVIHIAISRARERNAAVGITGQRVRPWLQAFTLGQPRYGAAEIEQQKRAVYDSGYEGWVLWHPGSQYDLFVPALEKTLVSRAKNPPVPAARPSDD
ncbi:MAG: putative glycoside hydrolase [Gemmatimonadota bacterium]|nr:putative glycoside hydrolase [Gemmatimonadota bacterium]